MGTILLLDQNTINKIAAGEVVERPAAVAKELIENAIDAGANAITVEIKAGGIEFLRITDNGTGIAPDQVKIAFERHATSKIRSVNDLLSVSSLGFRGEALASISAVAQVELVTKTEENITGVRYVIEGGTEKSFQEIGCPKGTTFVVRNLFYNVPARRKFLKSPQTEASYICDLVERLAISHPNISFKFMNNNQLKLQTSGNGNMKDVLYHIYGRDITSQLLPFSKNTQAVNMHGFLAKPVVSRGNRNYMNYFINGRYIKSPIINKAIEDAYKPYSMQHRYPMTAIQFEMDCEYIDVNVHPTKMEIRFTNGQTVYQEVYEAISDVLAGKEMIPSVTIGTKKKDVPSSIQGSKAEPFEKKRKEEENAFSRFSQQQKVESTETGKQIVEAAKVIQKFEQLEKQHMKVQEDINFGLKKDTEKSENKGNQITASVEEHAVKQDLRKYDTQKEEPLKEASLEKEPLKEDPLKKELLKAELQKTDVQIENLQKEDLPKPMEAVQVHLFEGEGEKLLSKDARKQHKIIGQLFQTYWMVEYQDKLFLIDQHAAHEKVLYERTLKEMEKKSFASQMLQPPIILSLSMREEQILKQYKGELQKIGFEIEAFGGREFSVRGVPANLCDIAQVDLLTELIDSLGEQGQCKTADILLERVASMSCKAAVKGNRKMSYAEAEALIDELMELDNPYHCPHGRPVIVSMSKYEVEKKFKRVL